MRDVSWRVVFVPIDHVMIIASDTERLMKYSWPALCMLCLVLICMINAISIIRPVGFVTNNDQNAFLSYAYGRFVFFSGCLTANIF